MIALSKIGKWQVKDVEDSGMEYHDDYFRTCTVGHPMSGIGDTSPARMAKLFGNTREHWNRHFVVQVAKCPLRCWYCYVDNLRTDAYVRFADIVSHYVKFKSKFPDIHVLHLMGGCPGRYASEWPVLRSEMDSQGLQDDILLTNVVLVEDAVFRNAPWSHIPPRTLVDICLKGTNPENFKRNTGQDWYEESIRELRYYLPIKNTIYSLIEHDRKDLPRIFTLLGSRCWDLDLLKVKNYEAVTRNSSKSRY